MGLNPRGRGRGRGGKGSFPNKGQRGGRMVGQGPMFRAGPPGMFCPPPMGFPPEPPFAGGPGFFPGPSAFNFGPPRPVYGKFPRKTFKRRVPQKSNDAPVPEIDLTKPWVTDEIKTEDSKKQECLEIWRKSKSDEDWSKYKSQKEIVKNLFDKAKEEYLASHQEEAIYWENVCGASASTSTFGYYCETCDKAFKSEDDLIWHEGEHETCGRDGCQFTAHPKIITKHIKMQHDSGLYRRIGKVYTEEEIAKWIEERKRRYPSRKVIEEKKALEAAKLQRGERIQEDNSKFNKSFGKKKQIKSKSKSVDKAKERRNRRAKSKKKKKMVETAMQEEVIANQRSVLPFSGIGIDVEVKALSENARNPNDLAISDDEWEYGERKPPVPCQPLINRSLSLLVSAYDSDNEEDEERGKQNENRLEGQENVNGDESENESENAPEEVKTIFVKAGDSSPLLGDQPTMSKRKKATNRKDSVKRKVQRTDTYKSNFENRKFTLLEKLLRKEIKHERNVILQCVHYVVKNNFFCVT